MRDPLLALATKLVGDYVVRQVYIVAHSSKPLKPRGASPLQPVRLDSTREFSDRTRTRFRFLGPYTTYIRLGEVSRIRGAARP
jgi:hypothetical protein